MIRAIDTAFWRGKRVLLTGHSGFKGSWLTLWLHRLGAEVTGISLPPATAPSLFCEAKVEACCKSQFCDIRDASALARRHQGSAAGDRFPFGGPAAGAGELPGAVAKRSTQT